MLAATLSQPLAPTVVAQDIFFNPVPTATGSLRWSAMPNTATLSVDRTWQANDQGVVRYSHTLSCDAAGPYTLRVDLPEAGVWGTTQLTAQHGCRSFGDALAIERSLVAGQPRAPAARHRRRSDNCVDRGGHGGAGAAGRRLVGQ